MNLESIYQPVKDTPPEYNKASFTIGSPIPTTSDKKLSSIENRMKPSASAVDLHAHIETGYSNFTPKREVVIFCKAKDWFYSNLLKRNPGNTLMEKNCQIFRFPE